jgi:hypothetical protein
MTGNLSWRFCFWYYGRGYDKCVLCSLQIGSNFLGVYLVQCSGTVERTLQYTVTVVVAIPPDFFIIWYFTFVAQLGV